MADISDEKLRESLEKRMGGLGAVRQPWERGNREVSNYCERWQSRYINGSAGRSVTTGTGSATTAPGGKANDRLYNSKAVRSMRTLSNGMSSGLSSPSMPWFTLKWAMGSEAFDSQDGKVWLDDVKRTLYDFLAGTNIYTAMNSGYRELGLFGSEAGLLVPDWEYGGAAFGLTWGEYWIGQDRALRVDTLYRDCAMPLSTVVDLFGEDKLSGASKRLVTSGKWDSIVPVMHAIEPNRERSIGKIDRTNMPIRSVYWESGSDKSNGILEFGGFESKPFWAPRWDQRGMDVYSAGPGMDCLPDSRKLQLQELRLQMSMDFLVKPALQSPVANRNAQANLIPGGITYSASVDMQNRIAPIWQVDHNAIPNISAERDRTEYAVDDATFANLFMAITNMQGVQPRNIEELARRHEEQLSQLGPVVDRVQVDKLAVIVMQAFQICSKQGRLPPVPADLEGTPLTIEFVSVLAQAQKMLGLGAMERFLGFIGNIAGVRPEILDTVDFDDMGAEYGNRLGIPARTLRSKEEYEAIRESRAQQEQQAQMAAAAGPMKDAAGAAELLSRTDVGGRNALEAIMQPGV